MARQTQTREHLRSDKNSATWQWWRVYDIVLTTTTNQSIGGFRLLVCKITTSFKTTNVSFMLLLQLCLQNYIIFSLFYCKHQ